MKSPHRISFLSIGNAAALAGWFLLASSAFSQVAIESPAFTEPSAPVITASEAEALRSEPPPSAAPTRVSPAASPAGPEVSINGRPVAETPRRFQYSLSATVRGVYDDNINISSFNRVSDYYVAIEPVITFGLGSADADSNNSLSFIYRPSIFLFADTSQNDSVQHLIRLQASHRFGHLSVALSQDAQILDGQNLNSISDPTGHQANIDVGARSRHQIYTSGLSGSYDLTGKLFLSSAGTLAIDHYSTTQISSQVYSGNLFLNYIYSDKLTVGLGGTGGYNTTDSMGAIHNDQTFEQANVRLSYSATAKISLSASGGIEFRQSNGGASENISPVYELAASYQPFDGTSLSLSGSRHTMNSAVFVGQDFAETTINAAVRQRFMQRFFFGLSAGYTNSDYFSTINGLSATRTDNYYYIEPSVDMNITRFWTAGAYYLHRQDSSSFAFFSFGNNQVGVRTSLTF